MCVLATSLNGATIRSIVLFHYALTLSSPTGEIIIANFRYSKKNPGLSYSSDILFFVPTSRRNNMYDI